MFLPMAGLAKPPNIQRLAVVVVVGFYPPRLRFLRPARIAAHRAIKMPEPDRTVEDLPRLKLLGVTTPVALEGSLTSLRVAFEIKPLALPRAFVNAISTALVDAVVLMFASIEGRQGLASITKATRLVGYFWHEGCSLCPGHGRLRAAWPFI